MKLEGITIKLITKTEINKDPLGVPIYEPYEVLVENVLIGQPSTEDIVNSQNLYGKKLVYILAIPKGDKNNWKDVEVEFFNQRFKTFGFPTKGIDNLVPGQWNMKVMVESYE